MFLAYAAALASVKRVEEMLRSDEATVVENETGFVYDSPVGPTTVTVCEPRDRSGDVASVIRIETPLDVTVDADTDSALAYANGLAILSSFARRDDDSVVAMTTIPVHAAFEEALELDEQFLYLATLTQGISFARSAEYLFEDKNDFDPLPEGESPGPWTPEEFKSASERLDCFTMVEDLRLTAELPWDEGAVSVATRDRTSLVTIAAVAHPSCGTGLMYKLQLPITIASDQIPGLVRALNLDEYDDDDAPPVLGAWCADGDVSVTFTGFIPNLIYHPQHVYRTATWLWWRSDRVRTLLTER